MDDSTLVIGKEQPLFPMPAVSMAAGGGMDDESMPDAETIASVAAKMGLTESDLADLAKHANMKPGGGGFDSDIDKINWLLGS